MHISLGSNCHPAYWLKILGLSSSYMPFDWTLSSPSNLLACVNDLIENNFESWLSELSTNDRGNVIDSRFPSVELFHHKALISDDPSESSIEKQKLLRRSRRFLKAIKNKYNSYYIYYPLTDFKTHEPFCDELIRFAEVTQGSLLIYYVSDYLENGELAPQNDIELYYNCAYQITPTRFNTRIVHHRRDRRVDNIWGQEPDFLRKNSIREIKPILS